MVLVSAITYKKNKRHTEEKRWNKIISNRWQNYLYRKSQGISKKKKKTTRVQNEFSKVAGHQYIKCSCISKLL